MFKGNAGFCNAHLGAVVLRCRLLGQIAQMKQAGLSSFDFWLQAVIAVIFFPFLVTCFAVGLPLAIREAVTGQVSPEPALASGAPLLIAATVLVYLLALGATIWFGFFFPRRDHLVLHENGVAFRLGFKAGVVLFKELKVFRIGREWTPFEASAMKINRHFHPGLYVLAENARNMSLTLKLTRGEQIVLKAVLMRYEEQDVNEFLTQVYQQHPGIFGLDDSEVS